MAKAWFVTAALDASTPLDGPFLSRDDCERRCLARTDRLTVLRAFAAKRIPAVYVPHLFEVREMEVRHLYRAEAATPRAAAPRPRNVPTLPDVVYTYSKSELLLLCRSLELHAPPSGADKAAILLHIERELRTLARGAAKGD